MNTGKILEFSGGTCIAIVLILIGFHTANVVWLFAGIIIGIFSLCLIGTPAHPIERELVAECPSCHALYEFQEEHFDRPINCPNCNAKQIIER